MAAAKSSDFQLQEVNEAVEEIVDDLICEICEGFPKPGQPRWYRCSDLHYICQFCVESKKVDKCNCKKKISKNFDKATEMLLKLKTLKFKCQFCKGSFTSDAITFHEIKCTQRLVTCPYVTCGTTCGKMVKFQDVLSHYDSHWKIYGNDNGSNHFDILSSNFGDFFRPARKIEAFGKVFLTMSTTKNGIMYDWVQLLGLPSEAQDFLFNVEYKGPESTHSYLGRVASIDETFNSIISRGKCSTISSEAFKTQFIVATDANKVECAYTVTIKKLDGETNQ